MAPSAVEAIARTAGGYCNLEYDLAGGGRGRRQAHVASLIARLTGAEAATVVNNNAAATLLILATLAADREVIVSRGQLVEIGGSFRLPEIMKAPTLTEVFFQMIYTMEYQIAQARVDPAHVAITPDLTGFAWTEFHRARELIDLGERIAEEYLPQIKALLPFYADYCKVPIKISPLS